MARKSKPITLSLIESERRSLEEIAAKHGCYWGQDPSISRMLKAIATGKLKLVAASEPAERATITSVDTCLKLQSSLVDVLLALNSGNIKEAELEVIRIQKILLDATVQARVNKNPKSKIE